MVGAEMSERCAYKRNQGTPSQRICGESPGSHGKNAFLIADHAFVPDITTRLLEHARTYPNDHRPRPIMREAADEIQRLRESLENIRRFAQDQLDLAAKDQCLRVITPESILEMLPDPNAIRVASADGKLNL